MFIKPVSLGLISLLLFLTLGCNNPEVWPQVDKKPEYKDYVTEGLKSYKESNINHRLRLCDYDYDKDYLNYGKTKSFRESDSMRRYYIQVRDAFETMGFKVEWDVKKHCAIVFNDYHSVILPANSSVGKIDDGRIEFDKSNVILDEKMLIPPSTYNIIMETLKPGYTKRSIEALWDETVGLHLQDELWTEQNIYDAGHYLMIPLHAAFIMNNNEWQQQFAYQFAYFMDNQDHIAEVRLDQLHYYYLISRFIVLANESGQSDMIPEGLPDYLYNRIINIWNHEPAWQWDQSDFPNMKERLLWKLNTQRPDKSYYRAIIDEELFTFAIAADLSHYYQDKDIDKRSILADILDIAYQVFTKEVIPTENGGWLFQPGVWSEHPDYAYVGNAQKAPNLPSKTINNIAMDTSHSHRFPLWLKSLAEAYTPGSNEHNYYNKLREGLTIQFTDIVLLAPSGEIPFYRTTNFLDGNNGVYRWNYSTQGPNNGYGPYELSGTMLLGWWTFLPGDFLNTIYNDISRQFPLSDDAIQLYVGPGTSRERHHLIEGSAPYVNGYLELISILAENI